MSAEALAGAENGGQRLLRLDRAVAEENFAAAEVAGAAGSGLLVEMGEQNLAAAGGGFAESGQRRKALVLEAAALVGEFLFVDLSAAQGHVLQPVEGKRVAGRPSRPARPIS